MARRANCRKQFVIHPDEQMDSRLRGSDEKEAGVTKKRRRAVKEERVTGGREHVRPAVNRP
jgi:hypothetical protein